MSFFWLKLGGGRGDKAPPPPMRLLSQIIQQGGVTNRQWHILTPFTAKWGWNWTGTGVTLRGGGREGHRGSAVGNKLFQENEDTTEEDPKESRAARAGWELGVEDNSGNPGEPRAPVTGDAGSSQPALHLRIARGARARTRAAAPATSQTNSL